MGSAWECRHVRFASDVDLKIVHPDSLCSASATLQIPEESLQDWDVQYSKSPSSNVGPADISRSFHASMDPLSHQAVLIRTPLRSIENLTSTSKLNPKAPVEPLSPKAVSIRGGLFMHTSDFVFSPK